MPLSEVFPQSPFRSPRLSEGFARSPALRGGIAPQSEMDAALQKVPLL